MKLIVTERWEIEAASLEAARVVLSMLGKDVEVQECSDDSESG